MKIIENNWNQSKEVMYKGNILIVPIWTNWIAVDTNGIMISFEEKPHSFEMDRSGWWESNQGELLYIGKVEFEENEDWKQSLEYVGE